MKKLLLREAAKHKLQNRRRKRWQKTVSILACLVVFCTVYALILPALTAEADTYCGKEEHTHTEDCYKDKLICGKEEGQGAHHHTDDCYREVEALVCPTPESDGHQHTEACYTEEQVLTCTNTDEGHVHSEFDSCYTTEKKLTCGMEEGQGAHHHTAECYETKKELICGQEENDGHRHTAECYEKELICGKEEHLHTLACYSNPNADVENGDVWQNTVSSVTLTGNWGADLAAIAQTQTGYTESTANYAVAEDGQTIHGYTRYGAWANDPYRDNWSAQFADFCLSYAGVPTSAVPQNSDCSAWNYTIPDGYTPKTGDLLLLDTDNNGSADHAGIVITADDSALTAIVGDADKAVRNNTYNIGSENIKGYVSIPENPALADDNNEKETTETTPAPEVTEEPQETPTPEITPEAEPTQEPETTPEVTEEPTQEPENKADDTANNIEVTPTPEVTPEATQEVQLEQQTVTAELYTDSTYATAEQSENAVVVSGNLPENGSIKAFPVNNISMEGMKVLCAWDITIFDAEGNKWEPAEGNTLSVKFQIPDLTEKENEAGEIYYIPDENTDQPEKLESQISDNGVSFEAKHFSIYTLMVADVTSGENTSNNAEGVDFKQYIDKCTFEHQVGGNGSWSTVENNASIDKNDKIRFNLEYTIPKGTLGNGNTIYYDLPNALKNFQDSGTVYDNADKPIGTYEIKNGRVNIVFNKEFADSNKTSKIVGWVKLEGQAKDVITGTDNKTTIVFNDKVQYEVKFEEQLNTKGDLSVSKSASNINNENGTLTYTITVYSQNGTNSQVSLADTMTNIGVDGQITVKDKNGSDVSATCPMTVSGSQITGTLPKMKAGDKYTIEYSAKLPDNAAYSVAAKNKIVAESTRSDGSTLKPEQEITTEFNNKVTKTGVLSDDGNSITWTITINPRKKDLNGWTLKDILNGEEYKGEVQISPAVNNQNTISLPYTFGENSNQTYTITYTTERDSSSAKVTNTADLIPPEGNSNGKESSGEIGIDIPNVYTKTGTGAIGNDDGTVTLNWQTSIDARTEIVNGWWWKDNASSKGQWFTQTQIDELKQTLDSKMIGGRSLKDNYSLTLEPENPTDGKYTQVTVTGNVPIPTNSNFTFSFSTTAQKPLNTVTFYNDMFFNNAYAQGKNEYIPSESSVKKIDLNNMTGGSNTEHEYHDGILDNNGTLKWRIEAIVPQRGADVIITETLPQGVTLTDLSIKSGGQDKGPWLGNTSLNIEGGTTVSRWSQSSKTAVESVITVCNSNNQSIITIPKDLIPDLNDSAYPKIWGMTSAIWLDVTVKINDNFSGWSQDNGSSLKYAFFANSVSVSDSNNRNLGTAEQTQKITFDDNYNIIKKYALDDQAKKDNGIVTYRIEVNPDAETLLENGAQLVLTDELKYKSKNYNPNSWLQDAADQKVTLVPDSVIVYEKSGTTETPLNKGNYSYVYQEKTLDTDWEGTNYQNTLAVTIPDSKSLIVEYKYKVTGKDDKYSGTLSNSAKLEGVSGKNSSTNTVESFKIQSSGAGAHNEGIVLYKVDEDNFGKFLNGAEFDLYKYENNQWEKVNTESYISQKESTMDGVVAITEIKSGIAYKLVETKAPNGYDLPDNPEYYFYVETEPTNKPDGFNGEKLLQGGKIYYPNKKSSSYTLPETGGIGTNRFTAVGLALMAGSLMCGYVMRRKRREGREN